MANPNRRRNLADRTSWQPRGSRRSGGVSGKLVGVAFALAVVAAVVLYLLIFSPIFWVNTVTVTGVKHLDQHTVSEAAKESAETTFGPLRSRSLLLVDPSHVAAELKGRFGDISKVTVAKKWPGSLTADVTERQSTLLWQSADKYYLVDQLGIAFADTQSRNDMIKVGDSTGLPVKLGEHVASATFIKQLEDIQRDMQSAGFKVTGFRVPESTFEVQAVTDQGYYALFDTTRSISFQVDALKRAIATGKPSTYADLRVPGRVYIK